ncbi:hypothetical protein GCK72_015270 [Caenorhabditis remanei]|uniref:Uncharacterized protein n=1 Tax=Caenorhabditis remanei TaxID=31234 RepID=A0A6A5GTM0_CAERE|nr:hypothetical protein GCK72_015270 [Caenorhabditis remanei]KAF1758810.1 hypothetical protein GCK72_015270 [Caenorhabditis remanei]
MSQDPQSRKSSVSSLDEDDYEKIFNSDDQDASVDQNPDFKTPTKQGNRNSKNESSKIQELEALVRQLQEKVGIQENEFFDISVENTLLRDQMKEKEWESENVIYALRNQISTQDTKILDLQQECEGYKEEWSRQYLKIMQLEDEKARNKKSHEFFVRDLNRKDLKVVYYQRDQFEALEAENRKLKEKIGNLEGDLMMERMQMARICQQKIRNEESSNENGNLEIYKKQYNLADLQLKLTDKDASIKLLQHKIENLEMELANETRKVLRPSVVIQHNKILQEKLDRLKQKFQKKKQYVERILNNLKFSVQEKIERLEVVIEEAEEEEATVTRVTVVEEKVKEKEMMEGKK